MKKYIFAFLLIGTFATYVAYIQVYGGLEQKPSAVVVGNINPTSTTPTPIPAAIFGDDDDEEDDAIPPTMMAATTPTQAPTPPIQKMMAQPMPMHGQIYRDGSFTGPVVDVYYGNVQVKAIITNGKIVDVQFLDHPQSRDRSVKISTYAMPLLTQEAIVAQSANVDIISGATATSGGFKASLASALSQAKI